jgi:LDH2 family malate/lactate/ureidoglycolate dehydrogenase
LSERIDRYKVSDLEAFACTLLERAGLSRERGAAVAQTLVDADLMGHTTHGLQLLESYLREIEKGTMTLSGDPETIADRGAAVVWDGHYLPGPWLVTKAMDLALARIKEHPVVTAVIRRSHHIGCLATYLPRATELGLVCLLMSSDPAVATVAPHGGIAGRYTPAPIAAGIPTDGDPILIDMTVASTSNGLTQRLHKLGRRLPGPWVIDHEGRAGDDPVVLFGDNPGAILPLGGMDLGYKGFALGLLLEALTVALGGFGRADGPTQWGAGVFLQVIDPEAFSGLKRFKLETGWLAEACRNTPVRQGDPPVRLPGEKALARRAVQTVAGVELYPTILPELEPWARKLGVPMPTPMT